MMTAESMDLHPIAARKCVPILGSEFTDYSADGLDDVGVEIASFSQCRLLNVVRYRAYDLFDAWTSVANRIGVACGEGPPGEAEYRRWSSLAEAAAQRADLDERIQATKEADAAFVRTRLHGYLSSIGFPPCPATGTAHRPSDAAPLTASIAALAILLTRHWAAGVTMQPQAVDNFGRLAPVPIMRDPATGHLDARYDFWVQCCLDEIETLSVNNPTKAALGSLRERLLRMTAETVDPAWWRTAGVQGSLTPAVATAITPLTVCAFNPAPVFDSSYACGITGDHLEWLAGVVKYLLTEGVGIHYDEDALAAAISLAPALHQARIRRPVLGEATELSEIPEEPNEDSESAALQLLREVLTSADEEQAPSPLHYSLAWHLIRGSHGTEGGIVAISFCYDRMLERALENLGHPYTVVLPVEEADWVAVTRTERESTVTPLSAAWSPDRVWELARANRPILIKLLGSPIDQFAPEMESVQQRVPIGELALMRALGPAQTDALKPCLKWAFNGGEEVKGESVPGWRPLPFFLGFDAWSSRDRLEYFRILEAVWNPTGDRMEVGRRRANQPRRKVMAHTRGFDTPKKYYEALRVEQAPLKRALVELVRDALDDIQYVETSVPELKALAQRAKECICGKQ